MSDRLPLARARKLADKILGELSGYCNRIAVAGSIRRQRPDVGDIDIVLIPNNRAALLDRIKRHCLILSGDSATSQNIICQLANMTQLDIWIARNPSADLFRAEPGNWGSILLCRTGSMAHNIALAAHFKAMGLHWNPYRGVMQADKVIAGDTEESIYEAGGLDYREPTQRESLT